MFSHIADVAYALPDAILDNAALAKEYPEWTAEKIEAKTGIAERHVAAEGECASDLAVRAAERLFARGKCTAADIDYILFCTQSPDYALPTTACLIQDRLGIPTTAGALDYNLGCSGFVTGLGLAKGLIETGQASSVLLLTAETYSKLIHTGDRSVRTIFGDAGAATLVASTDGGIERIGPFVHGTDGSGAKNLIVRAGGLRNPRSDETCVASERENGNVRSDENLYMNGAEVFNFTLRAVPSCLHAVLKKANLSIEDVDLFVFHQANNYMLEHLRKKIGIPAEKFVVALREFGNTVSCTIPIALAEAHRMQRIQAGDRIVLLGFGVGYSWSGTVLTW